MSEIDDLTKEVHELADKVETLTQTLKQHLESGSHLSRSDRQTIAFNTPMSEKTFD